MTSFAFNVGLEVHIDMTKYHFLTINLNIGKT